MDAFALLGNGCIAFSNTGTPHALTVVEWEQMHIGSSDLCPNCSSQLALLLHALRVSNHKPTQAGVTSSVRMQRNEKSPAMRGSFRQCGPFVHYHPSLVLDGVHNVAEDITNGRA